jgi:hypothetical protein
MTHSEKTVNDILAVNPILDIERDLRKGVVIRRFVPWLATEVPMPWLLCLYPFATVRPMRFFHEDALEPLIALLSENPQWALGELENHSVDITHAIETITTHSESWNWEGKLSLSTAADYASFEQVWHPEYQRYAEHALNHLINIPLALLGRTKRKDYVHQALSNRVARLADAGMASLTRGFNSTIRNAIAHGAVRFTHFGVLYQDTKEQVELYPEGFVRDFDELVRSSHTLVVGLLLFVLSNWWRISDLSRLPLGFLFLAAWGAGTHREFAIRRFIPSDLPDQRSQINIVCETRLVSRMFHQFATLHLAKTLEDLGGPRFDRAAISVHCRREVPSSMFIDLAHLRRCRSEHLPAEELAKVVEGSLLWHDANRYIQKLLRFRLTIQTLWVRVRQGLFEEWRKQGFLVARYLYEMRSVSNRSAESLRRLQGKAVLRDGVTPTYRDVQGVALHAIRHLRRQRVKGSGVSSHWWFRRRPSHVWLFVYQNDEIDRRLLERLVNNEGVLVEAEWKSRWSRSKFTLIQEPDEVIGRIKLRYSARLQSQSIA